MQISLRNVKKSYGNGDNIVHALKGVSMDIDKGDSISIMGTSGSGKTTLLHIIGTLCDATEGEYELEGKAIQKYSIKEKARLRNKNIGFVMQNFALLMDESVLKNVMLPMRYQKIPRKEMINRAMEALKKVGIEEKWKTTPTNLSGGQKQRVAIARAIVNDADILLCDEPTGALDKKTSKEIMDVFMQLHKEGKTLIIVTHDESVANCCNTTYRIEDGLLN
ncbi:MAG: ABC transporter ATP-binding protein [Eubacterium sp.]|nr:ABC transporter ATP-binding protein [Eubacterium sp.]